MEVWNLSACTEKGGCGMESLSGGFEVMKKYLLVFGVVLGVGCASGGHIPDAETSEAVVYQQQCGTCHALPHPKRNTYPQWEHLVDVMDRQRVEREVRPLTPDERIQILAYLKTHSR